MPDVGASGTVITSSGFNLIGNRGAVIFAQTGDQSGTGAGPLNPRLAPLALNGGATATHLPYGTSPALDKGNSSGSISDQRGLLRPRDLTGPTNTSDGADIGAVEAQLVVGNALSRKVHGAAGTMDINLLSVPPGIECRVGGSYQVIMSFVSPVNVGGVSVMSSNGLAGGSVSVSGAVATVDLTAVASAQTLGITLLNVSDGSTVDNVFVPLSVLVGDTTGNGMVNTSDIGQVKSQSGQAVTGSNFRSDVTANGGTINTSDIGLVKSTSGTSLP